MIMREDINIREEQMTKSAEGTNVALSLGSKESVGSLLYVEVTSFKKENKHKQKRKKSLHFPVWLQI